MRALLFGCYAQRKDEISHAQLYPFFDNRGALEKKLGFTFTHVEATLFDEFRAALDSRTDLEGFDALFFRPSWRQETEAALAFFQETRARFPDKMIVLLDPWDQVTGRFLGVAEHVDFLVKYQALRDPLDYAKDYIGGTPITDHLATKMGRDIEGWHAGSTVAEDYCQRIMPGWHIACTPKFKRFLRGDVVSRILGGKRRDIDVFCRVSIGPTRGEQAWYGWHRELGVNALLPLEGDFNLAVSGEYNDEKTVSSRQYMNEIKRSRIAFSPFGWGETTWRDYEAVAFDCLLVKPRIDHVAASPDIFVAGETYVPVEWDFSDLADTCRYYLTHWDEAEEIIKNARAAYMRFFEEHQFVDHIKKLIS